MLFFVFGEVMLSIKAAIPPSLYVAIDNRATASAAKLYVDSFLSIALVSFFCQVMILLFSGTRSYNCFFFFFSISSESCSCAQVRKKLHFTLKNTCALRQKVKHAIKRSVLLSLQCSDHAVSLLRREIPC